MKVGSELKKIYRKISGSFFGGGKIIYGIACQNLALAQRIGL